MIERRSVSSSADLWRIINAGQPAASGQVVTWATALQVTTALRCAQVIADGIATVPCKIYQKANGGRTVADNHPLNNVLMVQANPWQTGLEYRETMAFHLALCGNHFSFPTRIRDGVVSELIPIEPGRVTITQNTDYSLKYDVRGLDGTMKSFRADQIWHVRGPSWNSYIGMEPVKLAREAMGLALATEEHHAKLHANGAKVGGLYSVEGELNPTEYLRLKEWIDQNFAGSQNAFSTMILDRKAKFTPQVMTGVDSQHLETRRFQIEEICRAMGVLPIMVGSSDKATTYASAEQMFLAHAIHTTRPWHRRIEASIRKNLLSEAEREAGYYPKFVDTELLRGAAADRAKYYQAALGSGGAKGWMTQDEVRELEELDPRGGEADELPQPPAPAAPAAPTGATKP